VCHVWRQISSAFSVLKRGKTDAGDAEAICEAVTRPSMRFVAVKSADQQAALCLHRTRDLLVRQRTQTVNMIRGLLAEFGIVIAKGIWNALKLAEQITKGENLELPSAATRAIAHLAEQAHALQSRIADLDQQLKSWFRGNETAKRLETIPGIGVLTASALAASLADPHQFTSGRQFSAWLGLTPLARSSGGNERMGKISKMGDRYLRRLLVSGMMSQLRWARAHPSRAQPWLVSMLERKPTKLVAVALANKAARIAWVVMTRGESYKAPQVSQA
jgi:transposase